MSTQEHSFLSIADFKSAIGTNKLVIKHIRPKDGKDYVAVIDDKDEIVGFANPAIDWTNISPDKLVVVVYHDVDEDGNSTENYYLTLRRDVLAVL